MDLLHTRNGPYGRYTTYQRPGVSSTYQRPGVSSASLAMSWHSGLFQCFDDPTACTCISQVRPALSALGISSDRQVWRNVRYLYCILPRMPRGAEQVGLRSKQPYRQLSTCHNVPIHAMCLATPVSESLRYRGTAQP